MSLSVAYKFSSLFTFLSIYAKMTQSSFLFMAFLDFNYYIFKLYLYYTTLIATYNKDIYNDFINNSKQNHKIQQLLTYNIYDYLTTTMISIYNNDYPMITHHIITSLFLYLVKQTDYHHITLLTLFLFNITSPFLLFARVFNAYDYKYLSIISYFLFTNIFFLCRILYTTFILYKTIFTMKDKKYYYRGHFIALYIYFLQFYWMHLIISFYLKMI